MSDRAAADSPNGPVRSDDERDNDAVFESSNKNTGCRNAMIGCGVAAVLFAILMVIVGVYLAMNAKRLMADFTVSMASEVIEKAELPPEGKARIKERLNRLADDYKAGRLTNQQVGQIVQKIVKSPLLIIALTTSAEQHFVKPSGLSEDEKQVAHRSLERYARGLFESKFDDKQQEAVMNLLMDEDGEHRKKLKQRMTDEEVRAFLAKVKEVADAVEIPDEPFEVDIAAEFEKAIDEGTVNP